MTIRYKLRYAWETFRLLTTRKPDRLARHWLGR